MAVFVLSASGHPGWFRFASNVYPFTISQPTSFRHIVLSTDHRADFFYPDLGSYTTNVNIYAETGRSMMSDSDYLQSLGGQHVTRRNMVTIMAHSYPLTRADFKALAGRWTEERVSFPFQGMIWHLTISYDVKFRSMRATMLRMVNSFKVRPAGRH